MTPFEFGLIAAALAGTHGFAYYLGHRGFKGVSSDLTDVKKDVADLKSKLVLPAPVPGPMTAPAPVPGPMTAPAPVPHA